MVVIWESNDSNVSGGGGGAVGFNGETTGTSQMKR